MVRTPKTKEELKDFLEYESKKYGFKKVKRPFWEIGESRVLWKFVYTLRCAEYHKNVNHKVRYNIWRLMLRRMQTKYQMWIPENVCSRGLKIIHLGNVLISTNAEIGEDCSLHIMTGIVAGGNTDAAPKIGKNTVIGVGSILVGDIVIPDGCAIGANALVNKSFSEEGICIAGVPAKKISNNGKSSWK